MCEFFIHKRHPKIRRNLCKTMTNFFTNHRDISYLVKWNLQYIIMNKTYDLEVKYFRKELKEAKILIIIVMVNTVLLPNSV